MSKAITASTIINIVLGGWGDFETHMVKLIKRIEQEVGPVDHFRYSDAKQSPFETRFANMDILASRFHQYLLHRQYLTDPEIRINIIGYSQGGMVALYAAGIYPEIRKKINKYIAIASPHGGSLEKSLRQSVISGYNRLKKSAQSNFFSAMAMAFLDLGVESLDLLNLMDHNSIFLNRDYPNAVNDVFKEIPKEKMLQIYSPTDFVATPESCKRFETHMTLYCMQEHGHQDIVQNHEVIEKIIQFIGPNAN